jgi:non-homologous end joining protein Ku
MYKVKFYKDKNGESDIINLLDYLKARAETSKTPKKEIEQARSKMKDYIERHGE